MRFRGRLERDGKYWLAEVPVFDAMTQGRTRVEALDMIADWFASMYVSVLAVILGQALLFGDWRLIVYGVLFWLACHSFVLAYEEPTLQQTFGAEYQAFRANVPRWIPRLTPWRGA
jgi:hypothetical protein